MSMFENEGSYCRVFSGNEKNTVVRVSKRSENLLSVVLEVLMFKSGRFETPTIAKCNFEKARCFLEVDRLEELPMSATEKWIEELFIPWILGQIQHADETGIMLIDLCVKNIMSAAMKRPVLSDLNHVHSTFIHGPYADAEIVGKPYMRPPEYRGVQTGMEISKSASIWMVGVICMCLLHKHLYDELEVTMPSEIDLQAIASDRNAFLESEVLDDFIFSALNPNEEKRLEALDIIRPRVYGAADPLRIMVIPSSQKWTSSWMHLAYYILSKTVIGKRSPYSFTDRELRTSASARRSVISQVFCTMSALNLFARVMIHQSSSKEEDDWYEIANVCCHLIKNDPIKNVMCANEVANIISKTMSLGDFETAANHYDANIDLLYTSLMYIPGTYDPRQVPVINIGEFPKTLPCFGDDQMVIRAHYARRMEELRGDRDRVPGDAGVAS